MTRPAGTYAIFETSQGNIVIKLLEKPFRLRDLRGTVEAALYGRADRLVAGAFVAPAALSSDHGRDADNERSFTTSIH